MKIRKAVAADAEKIAQVHLASWKTSYPGIIPQEYIDSLKVEDGAARWGERIAENIATILVAEEKAGIFGFAASGPVLHPVEGYDGELAAIYLLQSHQRRGAGAALMRRSAGLLQEQGIHSMVVWALEKNSACDFYRRMGGVQVGEQTIEIGGAVLPEIAFGWLNLRKLCRAE